MTVRALWRGVVRIGDARVPVRLYPAVADRSVSFRLLDRRDREPVRRALVHPASGAVVAYEDAQRGYLAPTGELVVLRAEELASLAPEPSRDVTVTRFIPAEAIELRWYDRPFYLGPDEDDEAYHALAAALSRVGRVGVAHWVMRDREYHGALRLHRGYPVLVALRSAGEVLPLERFEAPPGDLDAELVDLARRLVGTLAADLDHEAYVDDDREAVRELVAAKAAGSEGPGRRRAPAPASPDLTEALRRSLAHGREEGGTRG